MKSTLVKDALILTAITLVAGFLLGLVYKITEEPIAAAEEKAQQEAYAAVFEEADHFDAYAEFDSDAAAELLASAEDSVTLGNVGTYYGDQDTIDEVLVAYDASNEALGYVITVTDSAGYGGDITFSIGIANDGTINGIAFTTLNETAGLGMKAKEAAFSSQFAGITESTLTVTKTDSDSDSEITAISGATITSSAVTSGVDAALTYFYEVLGGGAS